MQILGLAYSDGDVVEFLHRAGLPVRRSCSTIRSGGSGATAGRTTTKQPEKGRSGRIRTGVLAILETARVDHCATPAARRLQTKWRRVRPPPRLACVQECTDAHATTARAISRTAHPVSREAKRRRCRAPSWRGMRRSCRCSSGVSLMPRSPRAPCGSVHRGVQPASLKTSTLRISKQSWAEKLRRPIGLQAEETKAIAPV